MRFYLGTHMPHWLGQLDVPLFVSDRTLRKRRTVPVARGEWALDSGGFTELKDYGSWDRGPSPRQYAERVRRYGEEIGGLVWAAPQDWMCEPLMIDGGWAGGQRFAGTHLSVAEHQRRTVENFLELRRIAADLPFMPVLQGWTAEDYLRCVDLYADAGVELAEYPTVGLGSVCRRNATSEIIALVQTLARAGLRLHGFGVKTTGVAEYAPDLVSADSMAWSYAGRREDGCTPSHKNEANCQRYALTWRARVLEAAAGGAQQLVLPFL